MARFVRRTAILIAVFALIVSFGGSALLPSLDAPVRAERAAPPKLAVTAVVSDATNPAPIAPSSPMVESTPAPTAPPSPTPESTLGPSSTTELDPSRPFPRKEERRDEALQREIEDYIRGLDGNYAVAAYNFATGETIRINDAQLMPSASLYKLIVLYEVHRQERAGLLDLDDTVTIGADDMVEVANSSLDVGNQVSIRNLVRLMIMWSDNAAAYALLDTVGWDRYDEAASELGLNATRMPLSTSSNVEPAWRNELASTSASDMLHFFQLLGWGELVDEDASQEMLSILFEQENNDRIPEALPPSARVAHKTGELSNLRHDAGIVVTEDNAYAIVVMAHEVTPVDAIEAIREIARRVHSRYG